MCFLLSTVLDSPPEDGSRVKRAQAIVLVYTFRATEKRRGTVAIQGKPRRGRWRHRNYPKLPTCRVRSVLTDYYHYYCLIHQYQFMPKTIGT